MHAALSRNARHLWVVAFTSFWLISGPAAAAGQERLSIAAHFSGHPTLVALSPDGTVVATSGAMGSDGQTVGMKLWNARSGESILDLKQWEVESQVQGNYRFGNCVFSVIRTQARLVDVGSSTMVAFAHGHTLISAGRDGRMKVWDADAKREIADFDAHPGRANPHVIRHDANGPIEEAAGVTSLALSNDMTTIATGGCDGSVKLWDAGRFIARPSKKKARPVPARKVSKKRG